MSSCSFCSPLPFSNYFSFSPIHQIKQTKNTALWGLYYLAVCPLPHLKLPSCHSSNSQPLHLLSLSVASTSMWISCYPDLSFLNFSPKTLVSFTPLHPIIPQINPRPFITTFKTSMSNTHYVHHNLYFHHICPTTLQLQFFDFTEAYSALKLYT